MSDQLPPDPVTSAVQLLGAGGLGAIALKLIERVFARADKSDDVATGLRAEMVRRLETLERQINDLETRERNSYRMATELRAENRQLRRRYHDLINWIATQPGLPTPPKWLYEPIEGPTSGKAVRYTFRPLPELYFGVLVAAGTVLLLELVSLNPDGITDWRTWAVSLGVGMIRAGAGIALDYLRRSMTGDTPTPEQSEIDRLREEVARLERVNKVRQYQNERAAG